MDLLGTRHDKVIQQRILGLLQGLRVILPNVADCRLFGVDALPGKRILHLITVRNQDILLVGEFRIHSRYERVNV